MSSNRRSIYIKIALIFVTILVMGSFWLSNRESQKPINIAAVPLVPRESDPVLVTFNLNNPSLQTISVNYQFYANNELLTQGDTTIRPMSSETHQYAYGNPLRIGEQLSFVVRTQSELGNHDSILSTPPYPPQIFSSFISFAAMSSTMMSSMSSMVYYDSTFLSSTGINVGLVTVLTLLVMLVFLELTRYSRAGAGVLRMGGIGIRLSTLSWILFIIFIGVVYTRVVMIASGI